MVKRIVGYFEDACRSKTWVRQYLGHPHPEASNGAGLIVNFREVIPGLTRPASTDLPRNNYKSEVAMDVHASVIGERPTDEMPPIPPETAMLTWIGMGIAVLALIFVLRQLRGEKR